MDISELEHNAAYQGHEDEPASMVMVYCPEDAVWQLSLHPDGALYETPIDIYESIEQHKHYQDVLREHGCRVVDVTDLLSAGCENPSVRRDLEDFAMKCLTYVLDTSAHDSVSKKILYFVSDDYKRSVIAKMHPRTLARVILTRPHIVLKPALQNSDVTTSQTSFSPVGNVVFTRDQQITTRRGVVMGRFNAVQRRNENEVTEFVIRKLGITPVGHIPGHATLEGGDFISGGDDLAFMGIGLRSTYSAARYLMENDLLGTRRFAVVRDVFDVNQDRMHLDCIFSLISRKVACVDDFVLSNPVGIRLVDEWERDPETHRYTLKRCAVGFASYLRQNGFKIIPIPHEYQLAYGCNMLNIGNGTTLTVHEPSVDLINKALDKLYALGELDQEKDPRPKLIYVPFRGITSMYGSLHCASQVLIRKPENAETIAQRLPVPTVEAEKPHIADLVLFTPVNSVPNIVNYIERAGAEFEGSSNQEISDKIRMEIFAIYQQLKEDGISVYPCMKTALQPFIRIGALSHELFKQKKRSEDTPAGSKAFQNTLDVLADLIHRRVLPIYKDVKGLDEDPEVVMIRGRSYKFDLKYTRMVFDCCAHDLIMDLTESK